MKRLHTTICLLAAMLVCASAMAQRSNDTLWPKQSLRLEIAGKSLVGAGFTYERAWQGKSKVKHPRAFNSAELTLGYAGYIFGIATVGVNRNWYIGAQRKWTINCGLAVAALICPNPTSREIRDYQDSTQIYNQEYINPVEPWLFGNVSCRYTFRRMFVQASFTPFLAYDRAYNDGFFGWPWGGVSVGFHLNRKH